MEITLRFFILNDTRTRHQGGLGLVHGLCEKMGIETHRGVIYRPSSNGRAENAVKAVVNSLRLYYEQRKALWVNALPLAVWAVNDLPGIHGPYSPHRLVFGRDPIGFWGLSTGPG